MLAFSSWTWLVSGALGLLVLGILIRVTFGLIVRIKGLSASLRAASGQMQEALDQMRGDLETTSAGLEALRRDEDVQGR